MKPESSFQYELFDPILLYIVEDDEIKTFQDGGILKSTVTFEPLEFHKTWQQRSLAFDTYVLT